MGCCVGVDIEDPDIVDATFPMDVEIVAKMTHTGYSQELIIDVNDVVTDTTVDEAEDTTANEAEDVTADKAMYTTMDTPTNVDVANKDVAAAPSDVDVIEEDVADTPADMDVAESLVEADVTDTPAKADTTATDVVDAYVANMDVSYAPSAVNAADTDVFDNTDLIHDHATISVSDLSIDKPVEFVVIEVPGDSSESEEVSPVASVKQDLGDAEAYMKAMEISPYSYGFKVPYCLTS
jgi:hypothetical protein